MLTPAANGSELGIELKGNLAAMLGATVQRKRPSESDDLSLQVALVAGACNLAVLAAVVDRCVAAAQRAPYNSTT